MKFFQLPISVNADPEDVFNVVSDLRSKLAWVPGIRRVELETPGPPIFGARYLASSGSGSFEFVFQ